MGSWSETCALSNLPIGVGDSIYVVLITQTPYVSDHVGRSGCYPWDHWFQRSLPVLGTYDDYGRIAIDTKESGLVETVLDQFRFDLVEADLGPNEYHDTKVSKSALTWERLEEILSEGRAWIDREAEHKVSRADAKLREFHERALLNQAKQEAEMSEEHRSYLEKSRKEFNDKEDARDALFKSIYPGCAPGSSPVVRVYIRKDVYDVVMRHTTESFASATKHVTISQLRDEAGQYVDAMLKMLKTKHPTSSLDSDKLSVPRFLVSAQFDQNHLFAQQMSSIGGSFIPFSVNPRSALENCFKQYAKEDSRARKKLEPVIHAAAARLADTIMLTSFLLDHRMSWHPTTGTGSQQENFLGSTKFHLDMARLSADVVLDQLAERYANGESEYDDGSEWSVRQLADDTASVYTLATLHNVSLDGVVHMIADAANKKHDVKFTKKQIDKLIKRFTG